MIGVIILYAQSNELKLLYFPILMEPISQTDDDLIIQIG